MNGVPFARDDMVPGRLSSNERERRSKSKLIVVVVWQQRLLLFGVVVRWTLFPFFCRSFNEQKRYLSLKFTKHKRTNANAIFKFSRKIIYLVCVCVPVLVNK